MSKQPPIGNVDPSERTGMTGDASVDPSERTGTTGGSADASSTSTTEEGEDDENPGRGQGRPAGASKGINPVQHSE